MEKQAPNTVTVGQTIYSPTWRHWFKVDSIDVTTQKNGKKMYCFNGMKGKYNTYYECRETTQVKTR